MIKKSKMQLEQKMPKVKAAHQVKSALENDVISNEEAQVLQEAINLANEAIQVDSFPISEYKSGKLNIHQGV